MLCINYVLKHAVTNERRDYAYKNIMISPKQRWFDVTVPWGYDKLRGTLAGGLTVHELLTSKEHVILFPALISFRFGHSEFSGIDKIEKLFRKEKIEVGVMGKYKILEGKRIRSTGAITVDGSE